VDLYTLGADRCGVLRSHIPYCPSPKSKNRLSASCFSPCRAQCLLPESNISCLDRPFVLLSGGPKTRSHLWTRTWRPASPTTMTVWEDLSEPTPPSPLRATSSSALGPQVGCKLCSDDAPLLTQQPPLSAPRLVDVITRRAGAACLTLLLRRMALPVSGLLW